MSWPHGDWGWDAWLVMSVGMVAFFALVIWLVLNIARASQEGPIPPDRTPEDLLAKRFANGEIDDDEYQRRLDKLHASQAAATTP